MSDKGKVIIEGSPVEFTVTHIDLKDGTFVIKCEAQGQQYCELEVCRRRVIIVAPDGTNVVDTYVNDIGWESLGEFPGKIWMTLPIRMVDFV